MIFRTVDPYNISMNMRALPRRSPFQRAPPSAHFPQCSSPPHISSLGTPYTRSKPLQVPETRFSFHQHFVSSTREEELARLVIDRCPFPITYAEVARPTETALMAPWGIVERQARKVLVCQSHLAALGGVQGRVEVKSVVTGVGDGSAEST